MKKIRIAIISITFIILLFIGGFVILNKRNDSDIPENYVAIFHGGVGEKLYETYIYKIDNGHANYGFKYINVTKTTKSYGSSDWVYEITDKGEFDWTDGAFRVAQENGANSYVTLPNNDKKYTIEEFQRMFLMN